MGSLPQFSITFSPSPVHSHSRSAAASRPDTAGAAQGTALPGLCPRGTTTAVAPSDQQPSRNKLGQQHRLLPPRCPPVPSPGGPSRGLLSAGPQRPPRYAWQPALRPPAAAHGPDTAPTHPSLGPQQQPPGGPGSNGPAAPRQQRHGSTPPNRRPGPIDPLGARPPRLPASVSSRTSALGYPCLLDGYLGVMTLRLRDRLQVRDDVRRSLFPLSRLPGEARAGGCIRGHRPRAAPRAARRGAGSLPGRRRARPPPSAPYGEGGEPPGRRLTQPPLPGGSRPGLGPAVELRAEAAAPPRPGRDVWVLAAEPGAVAARGWRRGWVRLSVAARSRVRAGEERKGREKRVLV